LFYLIPPLQAIYIQRTDSVCIWYWVYCGKPTS